MLIKFIIIIIIRKNIFFSGISDKTTLKHVVLRAKGKVSLLLEDMEVSNALKRGAKTRAKKLFAYLPIKRTVALTSLYIPHR